MQSKTSCFNRTVFTKTLRRFWPLWLGYGAVWFLALPLSVIRAGVEGDSSLQLQRGILEIAAVASPLLLFAFSVLTAMAAFGWLYQSRSASFTAALPVTRSGMFLSSAAAGAAVLLGVNVFTALTAWVCALCTDLQVGEALLAFLAVSTLDSLCFYGFALLCAQLTGSLLILPLVYAVLQFTAVVVETLFNYLLRHILFGLDPVGSTLSFLSPIWTRLKCHVEAIYSETPVVTQYGSYNDIVAYRFSGWGVMACYALFGVLCFLLAWRLYQKRRMESAGDTVAISLLKPTFRWCMALGCALCTAVGVYYLLNEGRYVPGDWPHTLLITALLVLGGLLGWFGADMLIYKSFHVFRRHGRGALLLTALLIAFPVLTELDVLGVEKRSPEIGEYDMASVWVSGTEQTDITGEESLRELRKIQQSIVGNKALHESRAASRCTTVNIRYYRGDEVVFRRQYRVAFTAQDAADHESDIRALERFINRAECIEQRKKLNIPVLPDTIDSASLINYRSYEDGGSYFEGLEGQQGNSLLLTRQEAFELYSECILPDLLEGSLGRLWLVEDESFARSIYNLRFEMTLTLLGENGRTDEYAYFYTVPTVNSHRTNAWLEARGVKLETLWDYLERTGYTNDLEFGPGMETRPEPTAVAAAQ